MSLTIITINRNNAAGLKRTMQSVAAQTRTDFEYIVVDGASTDGSQDVIRRHEASFSERIKWISEPDTGIYSAMNKGIRMATGEYVQFLNSGDSLTSSDIIERIFLVLEQTAFPDILYGNMLKEMGDNNIIRDRCFAGQAISLLGFYTGTLNHSSAFIQRKLFDKFGLYDESLKIVSDWKWFMKAIIFGGVKPAYADLDISLFDMTGISETNKSLAKMERKHVLGDLINPMILADYDCLAASIDQIRRLQRHPWAYKLVWFIERCLFKLEKLQQKDTINYI